MNKINKFIYPALTVLYAILPLAAEAQSKSLDQIITGLKTTSGQVITLIFVLATLVFLWGVIGYVAKDDPAEKKKFKSIMAFGLIGLAIMASVWGVVNIFRNYFGVSGTTTIPLPSLPK